MKFNELQTLLRSRLMARGLPCKAHQLKDGSFFITVSITGEALSVDIPYTIQKRENGEIVVNSDDDIFEVKKLSSAVSVIAKDVRSQRSTLSKFTKHQ